VARSLMTGMASLALLVVMGTAGGRAETMSVVGTDGMAGPDGVNPGDDGQNADNGESVSANAGSVHPIIPTSQMRPRREEVMAAGRIWRASQHTHLPGRGRVWQQWRGGRCDGSDDHRRRPGESER
jgi:hypothetical protein